MRLRLLLIAVAVPTLASFVAPTLARAQRSDSNSILVGRVVDQSDSGGIAHATITVPGTRLQTQSDGLGYYKLEGIRPGPREVVVRAIGYAKLTQSEDLSPREEQKADFSMMRLPHTLETMVIEGHKMRVPRGFEEVYHRGIVGFGHFITREQIDSIDPIDLKSMLGMIAGVGTNDRGVTFPLCTLPQLWVDGTRMTKSANVYNYRETVYDFLGMMAPTDVQAMEVYTSHVTVPAEFLDGNPCGVIAIWTRRGP